MKDSGKIRTNHSSLRKQGLAFIDPSCFQRVTFRKKHSDDNIQRIIKSYIQRLTENYRELYS